MHIYGLVTDARATNHCSIHYDPHDAHIPTIRLVQLFHHATHNPPHTHAVTRSDAMQWPVVNPCSTAHAAPKRRPRASTEIAGSAELSRRPPLPTKQSPRASTGGRAWLGKNVNVAWSCAKWTRCWASQCGKPSAVDLGSRPAASSVSMRPNAASSVGGCHGWCCGDCHRGAPEL